MSTYLPFEPCQSLLLQYTGVKGSKMCWKYWIIMKQRVLQHCKTKTHPSTASRTHKIAHFDRFPPRVQYVYQRSSFDASRIPQCSLKWWHFIPIRMNGQPMVQKTWFTKSLTNWAVNSHTSWEVYGKNMRIAAWHSVGMAKVCVCFLPNRSGMIDICYAHTKHL